MRFPLLIAAITAAGLAVPATAAPARPGYVTAAVNLRAGPGTGFPAVDTIPGGARVDIHGCLSGYVWCDVGFDGERGFVNSNYLQFLYRGRRVLVIDYADEIGFPIIDFDIGSYWGHYYRHRGFYGRLGYWRHHWHHYGRTTGHFRHGHGHHFGGHRLSVGTPPYGGHVRGHFGHRSFGHVGHRNFGHSGAFGAHVAGQRSGVHLGGHMGGHHFGGHMGAHMGAHIGGHMGGHMGSGQASHTGGGHTGGGHRGGGHADGHHHP